jgi:hypothetical protein
MADDQSDTAALEAIHARLRATHDELLDLVYSERALHSMSADTAAALGYATGCISKAKALLGRDIDDRKRHAL